MLCFKHRFWGGPGEKLVLRQLSIDIVSPIQSKRFLWISKLFLIDYMKPKFMGFSPKRSCQRKFHQSIIFHYTGTKEFEPQVVEDLSLQIP